MESLLMVAESTRACQRDVCASYVESGLEQFTCHYTPDYTRLTLAILLEDFRDHHKSSDLPLYHLFREHICVQSQERMLTRQT